MLFEKWQELPYLPYLPHGIYTQLIPIDGVSLNPGVVEGIVTNPPSVRPLPVEASFLTASNHIVIGAFFIGNKNVFEMGIVVLESDSSTHWVEPS